MVVPKGYKITELGVIPEDWDVKTFDEVFNISGGYSASRDQLSNKGYCYLHYGDIHGTNKSYVDVKSDYSIIPKLDIKLSRISRTSLLNDGDVVFVDASEDNDGASKNVGVRNAENIPFISGLHTVVAKSKTNDLENRYKEYCFKSLNIKAQFKHYSAGTKVTGISKSNIKKILIPIPSLPEQTAIAEALSDLDSLIETLEKLIAKKNDIKQGAMQELLTGKRRLDGFNDDWLERNVGDFGEIITGSTPSTTQSMYWNGTIPWITPTDIIGNKNIDCSERQITELGLNVIRKLKANTVLITCIASLGKNAILRKEGACNQQINAIAPNSNYSEDFIYYLFENNKQLLLSKAGITATNMVSKKVFSKINMLVPTTIEEQRAIAKVLSDMDTEIEKLKNKLNKYKMVKQGMMQELLTGKRRLV